MSVATLTGVEARVLAGARLLDEKRPGWWREIDATALKMDSPCGCILGQTFGRFSAGIKALIGIDPFVDGWGDSQEWATDRGFDARPDLNRSEEAAEYDALRDAWVEMIESRRAETWR